MRIALVLVLGCGAPPARPVSNPPTPPTPSSAEPVREFRQLVTGSKVAHAKRTRFSLAFTRDRASLVETEERAEGGLSIADAAGASWTVRSTRTYRGTRKPVAGGIDLDLATDDMQPLHLHCVAKAMQVASTGPHRMEDACEKIELAHGAPIDALVCSAAGQPTDDDDDDDRLVFAPAPGIELASQHDGCEVHFLRRAL